MKPILFNSDMVRAILEGRKTVTRRRMKLPHCGYFEHEPPLGVVPPYRPGDILYVRETWAAWSPTYGTKPEIIYKADGYSQSHKMKWRPSIHMPRESARIFLLVTDVGVERLQDITPEQAMKEGVIDPNNRPYIQFEEVGQLERYAMHKIFPEIWSSTIKPKDRALYGWGANPWVWKIEFERCEKPEGD